MSDNQRKVVAIIGGGIAGLYCAFHLKKSGQFRVKLYEATERLGGKIETWRIDPATLTGRPPDPHRPPMDLSTLMKVDDDYIKLNLKNPIATPISPLQDLLIAEFGPMRIEPEQQPYLSQLLTDLNIKEPSPGKQPTWSDLVPFPPYRGEPPLEPRFTLEGEEAEQATLIDLLLLALRRVFEVVSFREPGSVKDARKPWDLPGLPYFDEANSFWDEFRNDDFLHRRFWRRSLRQWIKLMEEEHYEVIRREMMFRGTLLRDMGFWNLLESVLSHMATVKIRDWGSFYHLLPENPSAAEWVIFWLRAIKSTNSLRGIRGGMDWMVHRLCGKLGFDERTEGNEHYAKYTDKTNDEAVVGLFKNHKLIKVYDKGEKIELTFENANSGENLEPVEADHVILALPKSALEDIEFAPNQKKAKALRRLFDAVAPIPLLKSFFIIEHPFWEDNRPPSRYAHTTPTRELHYWKILNGRYGMMMLYTDRPGTQFWSDYIVENLKKDEPASDLGLTGEQHFETLIRKQEHAIIWKWVADPKYGEKFEIDKFENDRLLRTFLLYARENGAESVTADHVLAAGMHDWGFKPYEGACHAWRPGSDPEKMMDYLAGFSLADDASRNERRLHICGEAYSDYQGFIEGALGSASKVLDRFSIEKMTLIKSRDGLRRLPRTTIV